MPVVKRITFILFVTLSVSAAVWAYFHVKNNKKPNADAVTVLPDSCLVYLRTSDFFELNKKINSQNLLVDKLKQFPDIENFCNTLQLFDSLLNADDLLQEQIKHNKLHLALYNKNVNWLLAFNIKQLGKQTDIEERLAEVFHAEKSQEHFFSFRLNKNKKLFFTLNNGIALLSDDQKLLQKAFEANTKKLAHNKNFIAFKNTLEENTLLNVFIHHKNYEKSEAREKMPIVSFFLGGFSAGNVNLQPSKISVNGFLYETGDKGIFSVLKEQKAQETDFTDVLPIGTISFIASGFDNFLSLRKTMRDTSLRHYLYNLHQDFWQDINDSAMYNVEDEFYKNTVENFVNFETQQEFVLAKVEDTEMAREHLQYMSDSVWHENSDTVFCLKELLYKRGHKYLFFPLSARKLKYAALYGHYLFFCESKTELLSALHDVKNGNVMNKNISFVRYKNQNFSEKFNFLFYCAPNLTGKDKMLFDFETTSEANPFETFKHYSFSAVNYKSTFRYRWNVSQEAEVLDKNILWTLNLDNPCQTQPYAFVNHNTKENELIVQDEANVLYLINAKGTVLWKKQLNEKITSQVYRVDALKNKKYQMLFSTKHHIHLIDRNGKYLNNYPLKLPAEATSPLALLDYDNDKDYRLFIACKNKTIYNYSISGIKQDHFASVKTDNEVNLPVQYVKVGLSDYLVTADKEGKIYTFSRKGAGRIGLRNQTIADCKAFFVDATDNINATFLYYVDDKSKMIGKISFTDKKEIIELNKNINNAEITFAKVGNNRNTDLIITANNNLYVYSLNGNKLLEKNTNLESTAVTAFYGDMTHALFMTHSQEQKKLFVFNQTNQSEQTLKATALPLVSNLFNNSKKYLIVVNGRQLTCLVNE
ncbi:MAG: hypothetical protein KF900_02480 [Bacteroidetes bacterium]|nr:hypothetical protein [Bacteroidota bacterium]